MQGGIISVTMFNVVVDNVVRMWLAETVENQAVTQELLGLNMGRCLVFFYNNDGMIGSRDSEQLQNALNVLSRLFQWYGIITNVAKSHMITCRPRALRLGISEEVVGHQYTGVGLSYHERLRRRTPCL